MGFPAVSVPVGGACGKRVVRTAAGRLLLGGCCWEAMGWLLEDANWGVQGMEA